MLSFNRGLEYHSSTRLSRDLWRLCCNTGSMPRDRLKRIRTLRRTEECPCGQGTQGTQDSRINKSNRQPQGSEGGGGSARIAQTELQRPIFGDCIAMEREIEDEDAGRGEGEPPATRVARPSPACREYRSLTEVLFSFFFFFFLFARFSNLNRRS